MPPDPWIMGLRGEKKEEEVNKPTLRVVGLAVYLD